MTRVDSHQHFWHPARGDYHWMPADQPILNRQYRPSDLAPEARANGVEATVLVQAAATVEETEYLLGIADATDSVAGVVGWIDFERPEDLAHLQRLSRHPKFLGVRPMIQDIPDDDWMLLDDVQWAYQALIDLDLTFDALGFAQHLENFHTILTRYPQMRVVMDHCMKPQIASHADDTFEYWAQGMIGIAQDTNACCKLSGLVTEAGEDWTIEDLKPYAAHVLSAFGPERVMWGSDWPVCRLRAEYGDWYAAARKLTEHLSDDEKQRIFGGTAVEFYRLPV